MPEAAPRAELEEADRAIATDPADLGPVPDEPPASDPGAVELFREKLFLRRLRHGDERAFGELVQKHQDRVFDLVYRMIGDREEALDLSQEVFVAIHAAVPRFRGESRLSTWIFRVAKNHCLNRLKYLSRRERGRSTEISDVPEAVLERNAPSQRPDEAVSVAETRTMVQKAIAQLDEEHRLLVVLRDVEGLSYHEIATITEQPEGTVKSRLHRARAALAEIIAKLEGV